MKSLILIKVRQTNHISHTKSLAITLNELMSQNNSILHSDLGLVSFQKLKRWLEITVKGKIDDDSVLMTSFR